ncbi:MAG: CotH kinase family protein [Prolixibacteraceae bacterium]|jgi:hypothetical protein|nr:CotH kinase family protein [Prolixibacteraceae bacterium]
MKIEMNSIIKKLNYIIFVALLAIVNSCYNEILIIPDYNDNVFNVTLSESAIDRILEARGEQFYISPLPKLSYGSVPLQLDHMKIRGQSALNFQRKSYSVNLDDFLVFKNDTNDFIYIEKFKLLSMVYDYTYIENRLSHILLSQIGLWDLRSFYTQVVFNDDKHQGLYLFVEDPEDYLIQNKDADIVIRRYYRGEISKTELADGITTSESEKYSADFNDIYSTLLKFKGKQLYDELNRRMNINNYMKKMAFDFVVKNGDTTDEVFFWAKKQNGNSYFDILPWDYDDLFTIQPHEVGRAWAVGTVFGERIYETHADVLKELNGKLIFSIEDDIDYAIATDDYLYNVYLTQLGFVLNKLDVIIDQAFLDLKKELDPYYEFPKIIEQSKYDANETSADIYSKNIAEKHQYLSGRIQFIMSKIRNQ